MHEMGVLIRVRDEVRRIAEQNQVTKVRRVVVSAGRLSGILPAYLRKYYPMLTEQDPLLAGSELVIRQIPAEGRCEACRALYDIVRNKGICPACGSRERTVLRGREFTLDHIEV